jgi:hypothetical protein
VPTATLSQRVFDWLHAVEAATGRVPIIYSYPDWFAGVGFTDPALATYPLFIASYGSGSCAEVPAPWTTAMFWQYSATANVPGVGSSTDADRFIGTEAQLASLTMPEGIVDAGVDAPTNGPPAGGGCGCDAGARGGDVAVFALGGIAIARVARRRRQRVV